jgi:hypothetical protein
LYISFVHGLSQGSCFKRSKIDTTPKCQQYDCTNPKSGVSIHQVTIEVQAYFLTQFPEREETAQGFHHEENGDFKTVTEFNGCDRRKLMMNQQHCIYSTILT